jgi:hypothetical protein
MFEDAGEARAIPWTEDCSYYGSIDRRRGSPNRGKNDSLESSVNHFSPVKEL